MSDAIRQTTFEDYRGRWAADDRRSALKTALERRLNGGVVSEKGRERKVEVVAMEPIRMHLAAGRERVFAAWTEPALLVRWWGPGAEADVDLRIGGRFRLSMQFDWGAMVAVGEYREIVEPERLVFTFSWDGDPTGEETLVTLVLREAEGGTELTLVHEGFDDPAVAANHRAGWLDCVERLADLAPALERETGSG